MSDPSAPQNPYDPQQSGGQPGYGAQPPTYGAPPPAYGAPQGYGAPPPPNPYGGGYGMPGMGFSSLNYATWGKRVLSAIIDGLISSVAMIPYFIGYFMLISDAVDNTSTDPVTGVVTTGDLSPSGASLGLMGLGLVLGLIVFVWNVCLRQGRTGCTVGKSVMGIKLVSERTGQPIGGGMSFVRQLAHIIDGIPCYLGYLWPIWDGKRQTFADKIMSTVVIDQPQG